MTEASEKFISTPLSIQPSDKERIDRMAATRRLSFSALIRTLVMPQVEAWEREQASSIEAENQS